MRRAENENKSARVAEHNTHKTSHDHESDSHVEGKNNRSKSETGFDEPGFVGFVLVLGIFTGVALTRGYFYLKVSNIFALRETRHADMEE